MFKAVAFFVVPYNGPKKDYSKQLDVNHARLHTYARCMEEVVGPELLKNNLHHAICRLKH